MTMLNENHSNKAIAWWASRAVFWVLALCVGLVLHTAGTGCGDPKSAETVKEATTTESSAELPADKGADAATVDKVADAAPEPQPEPLTPDAEPTPEPSPEPAVEKSPEQTPEVSPEVSPIKTKVALIGNSDFVAGSYSIMSVDDRKKQAEFKQIKAAGDISGDLVIRRSGKWFFMLHRFNDANKDDRIDVIDLDTMTLTSQVNMGPKANPHDVVAVDQKRLFVTQYGKKSLIVYEENKTPVEIDLSSLAEKSTKACTMDSECTKFGEGSAKCDTGAGVCESDGLPEMGAMVLQGDKLYVAIQGLDRNDGFKPVKSVIAVIDTKTDTLLKSLPLKGNNPTAFIKEPSGTYLVVEANSSFDATDGGLERFDPVKETLSGTFVFTEQDAGGSFSFSGGAIVSATVGYLIVNDAQFNQALIQFDPSTGKLLKTLVKDAKLADVALNDKGELYLGDKGDAKGVGRGVRVFEASTGKELTTAPIVVADALPPSQFVFAEIDLSLLPKP